MILSEYKPIADAFGDNAKLLNTYSGLKPIIFMINSNKLSRYDEIHLGKFIASGDYRYIFKESHKLLEGKRMIFSVEYGILKLHIIRKSKNSIKILSSFVIGLFYGRKRELILKRITESVRISLINSIKTEAQSIRHYFQNMEKSDLEDVEKSFDAYKNISGNELSQRDKYYINKQINKLE